MLDAIPEGSSWQVVSIGKFQLPLSTMALALGGNIRVGMEDRRVYFSHGVLACEQCSAGRARRAYCT